MSTDEMGVPMTIRQWGGEPPIHLAHKTEARALAVHLLAAIRSEVPDGVSSVVFAEPVLERGTPAAYAAAILAEAARMSAEDAE